MEKEELLEAWVGLTGILKNSRLTNEMSYNESIIMLLAYKQYRQDGVGEVSVRTILEHTRMLKSLVNRTLNLLEKKEMIMKKRDEDDSRRMSICPTAKGIDEFLVVHKQSLELAEQVINIIGREDAQAIVRAYKKITESGEKNENKNNYRFSIRYSTELLGRCHGPSNGHSYGWT